MHQDRWQSLRLCSWQDAGQSNTNGKVQASEKWETRGMLYAWGSIRITKYGSNFWGWKEKAWRCWSRFSRLIQVARIDPEWCQVLHVYKDCFGHNVERQGTGAEQALHKNVSLYTKVNTTRTSQTYLTLYTVNNVIWDVFLKAWTAVDDHDMKTSLTGWAWNAQILKQQVLFAENCYLLPNYLLPAISSSQPSPF